jgi:nickel-dependent lactate racemase
MRINLPYGKQQIVLELDHEEQVSLLEPRRKMIDPIQLALAAPIGSQPLHMLVKPGQSVVIITSDITRPCPSDLMLPPVLDELNRAGIKDEEITIIFALGSHRPHTPEERMRLVGVEIAGRIRCIDSNPEHTIRIGTTRRGTPIEVFEPVVKADIRIALGTVEPHYFAGYSGGVKSLVPGVCSIETIRRNHALLVDPMARAGILGGNPVREDLEEGASMVPIDFILNVILDQDKRVVAAAAGDSIEAHRWACRVVDFLSLTPVDQAADIVVVSAGGYPKDINMYQAQKALDNAVAAVRPGGIIIWVAECSEGFGHATFEQWLVGNSADQIIQRIRENFVLGSHKAAAIARILKQAVVLLVSALPVDQVALCGLEPYPDINTAMQAALKRMGPAATVTVIPEGASILPSIERVPSAA